MQNLFLIAIEKQLSNYPLIEKSTTHMCGFPVTTFIGPGKCFIIDVLDEECCLTTKTKNYVYAFDDDDYLDVLAEIMGEISEFIEGG